MSGHGRSGEDARAHERQDREKKEVPDPYHLSEIAMLLRSLEAEDNNLTPVGRVNTRMRADFLLARVPDHVMRQLQDRQHLMDQEPPPTQQLPPELPHQP